MTHRTRRLLPWLVVLAPLGLLPFGACGDPAIVADAGHGEDSSTIDAADGASESAPPSCNAPLVDAGVPDGWVLDKTFSECCGFYVPPTKDLLPPPIEWEPCPPRAMAVLPMGTKCKALKVTWNPPKNLEGAAGQGYVDPNTGKVTLLTSRILSSGSPMFIMAEADGPTLSALFVGGPKACRVADGTQAIAEGRWGLEVYEPSQFNTLGFMGAASLAFRPTVVGHVDAGEQHSISAGTAGLLDIDPSDRMWLYDLSSADAAPSLIASAAQDKQLQAIPNFFAGDLAWVAEGSVSMKARLYHAGKTIDFIDYSAIDPEHGAGCLGGDGKDMVWVEGFGLESQGRYKKADYFTSPYTTDPTKLQPRRLRSDSYRVLDTVTTVVGCGYAARSEARSLRILRLSDGVSWVLPFSSLDAGFDNAIEWQRPFAVTCSEVFIRTERVPMRIELGSLGPGIPPD